MRTLIITPYDAQWPPRFAQECARLQAALGQTVIAIHHIGSTSVPGLAAKPVIDILLVAAALDELDRCTPALARLGYRARGENGIPGRRYFVKGGDRRTHQLHAFAAGDRQIINHLAFRDYLRQHPEIAAQYAQVKYAAAQACNNDIPRYQALKSAFIGHHLQRAIAALA